MNGIFRERAIRIALAGHNCRAFVRSVVHRKVWKFRGAAPRISTIAVPYRGGGTKEQRMAGTAAFLHKLLGEQRFRAFSVRLEMALTGWVYVCTPHVVLRSASPAFHLRIKVLTFEFRS
jgi:hypothetical protein